MDSVSSAGGVAVGSSLDMGEGSSLGMPEDDMMMGSDISVGDKDESIECM